VLDGCCWPESGTGFLHEEWPQNTGGHPQARILRTGSCLAQTPAATHPAPPPPRRRRPRKNEIHHACAHRSFRSHQKVRARMSPLDPCPISPWRPAASSASSAPNGAGKTTALRAILGLTAYEGQLKVLGPRAVFVNARRSCVTPASSPTSRCCPRGCESITPSTSSPACTPRFRRDRALGVAREDRDHGRAPHARVVQGHEDSGAPGADHGHRRQAIGAR